MDAQIIEQTDRRLYRLRLWQAVGSIWFTTMIVDPYVHNHLAFTALYSIRAAGVAIFILAAFMISRLRAKINNDPSLKEAIYNELYRANELKAMKWGFWLMLVVACVLTLVIEHIHIPATVICLVLINVGVISASVARLVLNR